MVSRLPKIYIPLAFHLRGVSLFQHPKEAWWTQTCLNYFISDHSLPILLHTRSLPLPFVKPKALHLLGDHPSTELQ